MCQFESIDNTRGYYCISIHSIDIMRGYYCISVNSIDNAPGTTVLVLKT